MEPWELKAQAEYAAQQQCGQAVNCDTTTTLRSPRRSTPKEEAEQNSAHYREKALQAALAADFYRTNPAFSDFVELIRSGAIQI